MKTTTAAYKRIIASGDSRKFLVNINMTLADGTSLTLTEEDIWADSFSIDTASSGKNSLVIGYAVIGKCSFQIENFDERFNSYDFFNATAVVWVKLVGDTQYYRMGFFTVDNPEHVGVLISLKLLNNMWKFDDKNLSEVGLSFPCSCQTAITTVCAYCGVTLATSQFHGYQFTLTKAPEKDMNCREFIQYVAMIGCNFCIIDDTGALRLKWYDVDSWVDDLDGGTFDTHTTPYSDGDIADGGNFLVYEETKDYDGGSFLENTTVAYFTRIFGTPQIGTDEINVTGVKIEIDETTYMVGTEGYVIDLKENPLLTASNVNAALNLIWDVLRGFRFRTFDITTMPDLAVEIGDCCAIRDAHGNYVHSYITNNSFGFSNHQASLGAITPMRSLVKQYSKTVQAAVEIARKRTDEAISTYDVAVQLMNTLAINAMGAYQDYEDIPIGGRIYYLSNMPITKVSGVCQFTPESTVFKISGSGFFVSTQGGLPDTWDNGYDPETGVLLVNILKAIGLEAEWIVTGLLRDKNNYNRWNLDTGEFKLSTTATVGGKTVQQIANEAQAAAEAASATALASAVRSINGDIADLQDQIDGNVTTWYYLGAPTLNNLPACQWTTATEKDNHIGDIYYDSATGYAYRFMKDGNNYVWVQLSDSDIAAALAVAQEAQDTADHKRRVFITQPVPPYDEGDLWSQGGNGDLMRCKNRKDEGQDYALSDWEVATKYTDDTLAKATYGTCSTSASVVEKTVALSDFALYSGARISVQFTYGNTATNPTLNVNNTGAKPIFAKGSAISGTYYWNANALCQFVYDDTNWIMQVEDQQELFDRITNGGQVQGIYLQEDPNDHIMKLYINATYVGTGILASQNLVDDAQSHYTRVGMKIDTSNGVIKTPKFGVDESGNVYIASGATIGDLSNYATNTSVSNSVSSGINGLKNQMQDGQTTINGGCITTGTINANLVNVTNLNADNITTGNIQSSNFNRGSNNYFSRAGSQINLSTGDLITPYFSMKASSKTAYCYHFMVKTGNAGLSSDTKAGFDFDNYSDSLLTDEVPNTHFYKTNLRIQTELTSLGRYPYIEMKVDASPYFYINDDDGYHVEVNSTTIWRWAGHGSSAQEVRWQSSSDKRLKKNIKDLDIKLSINLINRTEPKSFNFIDSTAKHYGMIAQDARAILDDLGEKDADLERSMGSPDDDAVIDDVRIIDYEQYIPHLINYVKDLRAEIDALKEEIKTLKGEN